MSRLDLLKEPLTRAIERVVRSFDQALERQLGDARARIAEAGETLKSELPSALLADPALASLVEPQAATTDTLLDAAARIDAAASQGEVLVALLAGARGIASRSAFLVAHEDHLALWAGDGFDDDGALSGKRVAYGDEPWQRLRGAAGAVRLNAAACAAAAADLGVAAASEAVCVPFLLRARLGGFLYADRRAADPDLDRAALCLLTHLTALSLETLAIRGDGLSPALRDDENDAHDALALFAASAEAPPQPAAGRAVVDREDVSHDAAEIDTTDFDAADVDVADFDAADFDEVALEDADPSPVGIGESTVAVAAVEDSPRTEPRDLDAIAHIAASAEAEAAPTSVRPLPEETDDLFGEDTVTEQIQVDVSFPQIGREEEPADAVEDGDTLELEPIDPAMISRDDDGDATVDTGVDTGAFELDDERFAESAGQQTVRFEVDREAPAAADATAFSEDPTIMSQRSAVYRPPSEPAAAPAAGEGEARKSTEVMPPSDLSGPGTAFSAGGTAGDAALREEARRLARLLVSEIKLYNEDQLEEGRREGNIYGRLKEDVDRSRKMYHERIDPRLGDADRYFYQELVDRLAGGNTDLLGM